MFEPIPLSLALAETPEADAPRRALAWARSCGFAWVQLDAAQRDLRPRELGESGRRDLAAAASRSEVRFSGLDLWIPPKHFVSAEHTDRAVVAVIEAVGLLGDLIRLRAADPGSPVSIAFPKGVSSLVVDAIAAASDRAGVIVADHSAEPAAGTAVGIDPALRLMAGGDPTAAAVGPSVVAARLNDANAMGRCAVGSGKLEVLEYAIALSTNNWRRPVVLDLRGLPDPVVGLERGRSAWDGAMSPG